MTRKNVWLAALATLALGGAGLLLNPFGGGTDEFAPGSATWGDEPDHGEAASLSATSGDEAPLARTQVADTGAAVESTEDDEEPRPSLTVSGRVVSDGGAGVAGARVAVSYRMSFDGARGREVGGGFGGGGGDRGRAFRPRPAAQAVITDAEGRFTLTGRAFATSTLDVQVVHKDYAPAALQRDWQRRDGVVQLGDIVVGTGALVSGFVVDVTGKGIANADVRFQPGGGGGPGQFGGRGGRGRGGRGGNEEEPGVENLLAAAKTDTSGFFRIEHVPEGSFRLQARAARYLPALTEALQAKSAAAVDAGQLKLILGVELRGSVVDLNGAPIADARVEAGASRREGENRGPNRGGPGQGEATPPDAAQQAEWQAMAAAWRAGANDRRTRTDKRGEFVLDSLPPGALRLRVEHPRFVTDERQGIDPQKEARVVVRLEPALALSGRVVDAVTTKPIEVFAIAAREYEDWGNRGGRGGPGNNDNPGGRGRRGGGEDNGQGRRRGGNQEEAGAVDAEAAAMRAAAEARTAQRTAYLQDRLGSTGQVPRNPGRASKHADGHFTLPGLQPGRYVIDVMADEYVGVVVGPFELAKGQTTAEVTINLRLGSKITGVVEDKLTGTPLADVHVELQLPDLEAGAQPNEPLWNMFRREVSRVRVARTRTDAKGRFVLRPQRSGDYWLALEHEGYNAQVDRAVFVPDGQPLETPPYALVPASEVFGSVLNALPDTQYTVTFLAMGNGQRFTTRADKDLRYRVESIEAGSYYVLLSDGSDAGNGGGRGRGPGGIAGMGTRLADLARGNTQPDVVIGEGAKVQFDVDARAQQQATVRGKVMLNGVPAANYDVSLNARDEVANAGNGNGFMGRVMGRFLSGRTDEQGQFSIGNVLAGSYTLEVRRGGGGPGGGPGGGRGRGGGGGGSTVHRELLTVTQGSTIERMIAFAVGTLAFEVAQEDGKPIERGNVSLVLRTEAASVPADQWRTLPSFTNTQVRNGTASLRELKLGEWAYRLQAQGQAPVEGAVFVDASPTPTPVKVKVKAATPPANGGSNTPPAPGGNPGTGNPASGNRGNANPANGNRGNRGNG